MSKAGYSDKLPPELQVDMEERIAAMIFDSPEDVGEDECAQLSRDILYKVLREFRPDFLADADSTARKEAMPPIGTKVQICYTNHRGETAMRRIVPARLVFGSDEWHFGPQWLLEAYDMDRKADRTFAMQHIHFWQAIPESPDGQAKEPGAGDAPQAAS